MFWLRSSMLCLLLSAVCLSATSQTFSCDGRPMFATNTGDTRIYRVSFIPFAGPFYTALSLYIGENFNSLGFNPKDNYIYATQEGTNNIVRLRSDNTFEVVGSVPFVGQLQAFAGDCTPDGQYLCHDNELDQILVFSVIGGLTLEDRIDLYWDPSSVNSGPFTTRVDDFAIDPNDPTTAYAFQAKGNFDPELQPLATGGHLLQIDLGPNSSTKGMVTPLGLIQSPSELFRLGSLAFNDFGTLYGYGAQDDAVGTEENRLFTVNSQILTANAQGTGGPAAPATDGCSCPYTLNIDYTVDPLVATCTGSEVVYNLRINNRSFETISGAILTDTIAEGMVIEAINGNINGNIDPTTGVGTRFLTINDVQIPPRGNAQMTIRARIDDVPVGNVISQVYMRNLPILFGDVQVSDDPNTSNTPDPAIFAADAQFLDDVTVDITSPTDCLADNDGEVVLTSPFFLPGQEYEIGLLDEGWNPFNREIVVDGNNTFVIDSLPSGEYRLDLVRPLDVRCSYEWKNETILIEPPNEQLQASISNNGPVCAGNALEISANLEPGGTALWTTPVVIIGGLGLVIDSTTADMSGTYEMVATYGACEQIREMEVVVTPPIDAEIAGDLEYCERDNLRLKVTGNGDLIAFDWVGPDNFTSKNRQMGIESAKPVHAGRYEVVVDNGACIDTAEATVTILPSPTISLPRIIETDFCGGVQLKPEILGDNNVTYNWTPNEGLSCYDCPSPEVQVPFQPRYSLSVINDFMCTDSVDVSLDLALDNLVYTPNVFSPNRDGVNDFFQLFPGSGVAKIKRLEIVDRWGAILYSRDDIDSNVPQEFWDGSFNGKTSPPGVYVWQLEIELVDGSSQRLTGDVTLLR